LLTLSTTVAIRTTSLSDFGATQRIRKFVGKHATCLLVVSNSAMSGEPLSKQVSATADRPAQRPALRPSCCTQRRTLSVINWRPTTVASYHTERPPKLTTRATLDVQLCILCQSEFGIKFQREVPLFYKIPECPFSTM